MEKSSFIGLILMMFNLVVIAILLIKGMFIKKSKVFKKVLYSYICVSMIIIVAFTIVYVIVFATDLQNLSKIYNNELGQLNIPQEEKQKIFEGFSHFKGLNIYWYKEHMGLLFLDLLYFSSMTFFTVGYGDITVTGIIKIFPIVESSLGVALTGIVISMVLSDSIKMSKKEDTLRMFIFRGYDILFFEKTSINFSYLRSIFSDRLSGKKLQKDNENLYNVHLIDSNGKVATVFYINLDYESRETFENFQITWEFNECNSQSKEYCYKFAQYLYYELRYKIDNHLQIELDKFIINNKKIELKEFQEFLIKLKNFLIHKPLGKRKYDEIKVDNRVINLITQYINANDKIQMK